MFFTYILKSIPKNRYYIGSCEDMEVRLAKHNAAAVQSTKYGVPWIVVHTETFPTRSEAYTRELEIKSYKSGIKFKKLLGLPFKTYKSSTELK